LTIAVERRSAGPLHPAESLLSGQTTLALSPLELLDK
jgi:hypothetical protein